LNSEFKRGQTISNLAQTLTASKGVFLLLEKLEVKYKWKGLEIRTTFLIETYPDLK
jgi:hypothetical protein